MKRTLLAFAMVLGASAPAFAGEYYIIQGMMDKQCRIVETIPKNELAVILGGPTPFPTREEAEAQMRKLCKTEHGTATQKNEASKVR